MYHTAIRATHRPVSTPLHYDKAICQRCGIEYRPSRNPDARARRGNHCLDCADVLGLNDEQEKAS